MTSLEGKVAVITGGARGIGRAIAEKLAGLGVTITIFDVDGDSAKKTADILANKGVATLAVEVDIVDLICIQEAVNKVIDTFGRLDILINNAGITCDNLFLRMKEEEWDRVLAVNLKGAFNLCRAAIRPMIKARGGRIINIASVVGLMGNVAQTNYAASKAGLIGFTKSLAKEVASRGITVNAVAPGYIHTEMTEDIPQKAKDAFIAAIPLSRAGKPEDVANAVAFLASEESAYITGHVLNVDGGMVM